MVDFPNIVKITTIFQKFVLSHEIRDLHTCNPGAKKFLNFLKKRFLSSESMFELFMAHREVCDICKKTRIIGNIFAICCIPLSEDNPVFGPPGEKSF